MLDTGRRGVSEIQSMQVLNPAICPYSALFFFQSGQYACEVNQALVNIKNTIEY
jgi:hypothetical protein